MAMIIKIDPVSKPRMTQRDKWMKRPCVMKYRAFADELRIKYRLEGGIPDFQNVVLNFYIKMPKSWSKKKQREMAGQPHRQKPDIDNLTFSKKNSPFHNLRFGWR